MDSGEKICKKIDFWIAKAVKKLKKYVILYIVDYISVSYTHLDVYKRQAYHTIKKNTNQGIQKNTSYLKDFSV